MENNECAYPRFKLGEGHVTMKELSTANVFICFVIALQKRS